MLVLFETSAGFALFKVLDEGKLKKADDLWKDFQSVDNAQKVVSLSKFARFKNTADALESTTALIENKLSKNLKKFLKKQIVKKSLDEKLAVYDAKLGGIIKEELGIKCVHDSSIMELLRGIRLQLDNLVTSVSGSDMSAMSLGLAHSLSRYKLKFSPDKVDTMIVQAIALLDDLDKELNTYAMRVREWYGWHFPELSKVVSDNLLYARTVQLMGIRTRAKSTNFSTILPEELEAELKEAAEISMGTEVSDEDIDNIKELCQQVISISEYREQLYEYLKNRMLAIAPNLTVLVGELVGARLIAHAGSLLNLSKHPASTVQILGAEKALFRALKTKHETPKYGLIYHASLVGQAPPKHKGKISRVLAAKAALAIRYDALGEEAATNTTVGVEGREKVERRLRQLEGGVVHKISGTGKGKAQPEKYKKGETTTYKGKSELTIGMEVEKPVAKKDTKEKKVEKKVEKEEESDSSSDESSEEEKPKKKDKKDKKKKDKKDKKRRRESNGDGEKKKKKKKA